MCLFIGAESQPDIDIGDVLLMQEVSPIKVSDIKPEMLKNAVLYGPQDLVNEVREHFSKESQNSSFINANSETLYISKSFLMEWLVVDCNKEAEDYVLVAIGKNESMRERDWFSYKALYPNLRDTMAEKDYMTANVKKSFFRNKAMYLIKSKVPNKN